jgi:class 3 adenylate cyclase
MIAGADVVNRNSKLSTLSVFGTSVSGPTATLDPLDVLDDVVLDDGAPREPDEHAAQSTAAHRTRGKLKCRAARTTQAWHGAPREVTNHGPSRSSTQVAYLPASIVGARRWMVHAPLERKADRVESPIRSWRGFDVALSVTRINGILSGSDTSYEETDSMPDRDKLTFTNGFYVNCCVVWVGMRESSALAAKCDRPTLAKINRAYISELVAVMHLSERCVEVNVHGDAVWGIFDTPHKPHVDSAFLTAVQCRTLLKVLNCRLGANGYDAVGAGIGMHYGRALMIKAGYSGSGIDDIVYMGDVVNAARAFSDEAATSLFRDPIVLSELVHHNLNQGNKGLCTGPTQRANRAAFTSSAVNTPMQDWIDANCS